MSTILKHSATAVRTVFPYTPHRTTHVTSLLKARLCLRSRGQAYATSSVVHKDLVQDLYLKELKLYKAPPAAKDAHVGAVRDFKAPALPSAPTLPDLAVELAAYDATEPTRAAVADAPTSHGESAAGAEAYLAFLEADVQEEAHH
ncbi:ATP synthase complex subunit H-domain-containing protein [Lactifluus volemus]|nr:ATP synthase complex subunit H-domain-containing protein [Lactifluus volemus]